jgi:hypothetical protein
MIPPNTPFKIRLAAVLALVYGGCQIVEVIAMEFLNQRMTGEHHIVVFDTLLGTIAFLVLSWGICLRRRWAWWLGLVLLGVPALTFQTEIIMQGVVGGILWFGHTVMETWVDWTTAAIGHPSCLIAVLILITNYQEFVSKPYSDVALPHS